MRLYMNMNSLIPIHSSSLSPPVPEDSTIAVGYENYVIGGLATPSSSVRILDCRKNTWRDAPNMSVARTRESSSVLLDQTIYVMGGCGKSDKWCEVFDIKTETWSVLPCHIADLDELRRFIVVNAVQGKLYIVAETKEYTYEPKSGTWEVIEKSYHLEVKCVIENVMYGHNYKGYLMWYDFECREWKEIKGLEKLRDESPVTTDSSVFRMVNFGGKLVVMWSKRYHKDRKLWKTEIWCVKIALEKRVGGEIWGKTEWLNTVLTLPGLYHCLRCVAVVSI